MHMWRQQCRQQRRQRRRPFCAANSPRAAKDDFFSDVAKFISLLNNRLVYLKGGREIALQENASYWMLFPVSVISPGYYDPLTMVKMG